jgi:hypothetical protein
MASFACALFFISTLFLCAGGLQLQIANANLIGVRADEVSEERRPSRSASNNRLIFDIGMNRGDDTKNYLDLGYDVVAVEANPLWAKRNSDLFDQYISKRRLTILNRVLANSTDDSVVFYIGAASPDLVAMTKLPGYDIIKAFNPSLSWSPSGVQNEESSYDTDLAHFDEGASMSKENACRPGVTETCREEHVQTTTCTELIKKYGIPHYIKIDIEGFDGVCMMQLAQMPCDSLPAYISFEDQSRMIHPSVAASSEAIIKALSSRGYTWKITSVSQEDHGKSGSGGFGEEATDFLEGKRWIDERAAIARTPEFLGNCWTTGHPPGWSGFCDIHGKLNLQSCKPPL